MNPGKNSAILPAGLGKKLQVPVYEFLKESLTRKYGEDFYHALDTAAKRMAAQQHQPQKTGTK